MPPSDLLAIPPHHAGQRIGLFGGSFNPFHDGHKLVAEQCLARLGLDAVWLLVSPGNPLKSTDGLPSLEERVASARAALDDPRLIATGLEGQRDFHFTIDTLDWLVGQCPGVHFVWIMGADNLVQFDRWERWQDIAALMPIAVYARPGSIARGEQSHAAQSLADARLPEADAATLADRAPPAWVYLHGTTSPLSSSAIRASETTQTE